MPRKKEKKNLWARWFPNSVWYFCFKFLVKILSGFGFFFLVCCCFSLGKKRLASLQFASTPLSILKLWAVWMKLYKPCAEWGAEWALSHLHLEKQHPATQSVPVNWPSLREMAWNQLPCVLLGAGEAGRSWWPGCVSFLSSFLQEFKTFCSSMFKM